MTAPRDESELVARAQAGDHQAFSDLVRLHQARLRALVARQVVDPDDICDVVQEAFIDAFRGLGGFDRGREFGPWLRTLCRNRMTSFLRSRAVRRGAAVALVDDAIAARSVDEPDEERGDEMAALKRCLDGLQPSHRALVAMRYGERVPVKDISDRLGKSQASVSMMLMRIRAALQRCIGGSPRAEPP